MLYVSVFRFKALLICFTQAYERTHMVPAQSNKDVAGYTTDEILHFAPEAFGIKNFFRNLAVCLLEDTVRVAMKFVPLLHFLFDVLILRMGP